jgi:hypothetical protein
VAATAIPAALTGLRDALKARPALSGVTVATGDLGDSTPTDEGIMFLSADQASAWAALGEEGRMERFTIEGILWAEVPGADEDTITEARDRAVVLLNELDGYLRTNPTIAGVTQLWAELAALKFTSPISTRGRVCLIEFDINVRARV